MCAGHHGQSLGLFEGGGVAGHDLLAEQEGEDDLVERTGEGDEPVGGGELDAVPASLTADGTKAFGGMYRVGEALDAVTAAVSLTDDAQLPGGSGGSGGSGGTGGTGGSAGGTTDGAGTTGGTGWPARRARSPPPSTSAGAVTRPPARSDRRVEPPGTFQGQGRTTAHAVRTCPVRHTSHPTFNA